MKGRLYTFTVLQLLTSDRDLLTRQLDDLISKAPRFFDKTPIVIDFSALHEQDFDFLSFCEYMREHRLLPVAVQGLAPSLESIAQNHGLAVLHSSSAQDKPMVERSVEEPTIGKTKLLTTPVRSGQQVVGKGGDLIVTASVSHGAELLAEGNIHIYGTLRGRALAGISGDQQARIFCQSLEAELVSIAGFYRLSDAIQPHVGPCQIYLRDEQIHIESLC